MGESVTSCPVDLGVPPQEALARLVEGNVRFVRGDGLSRVRETTAPEHRARLAERQWPFATVVSCSDSRVPAEFVFDQGLGDLFIVRNAGAILGVAPLASVEFAVTHLGTSLVVVLAHERCGAIEAAHDAALEGVTPPSPSLIGIVERLAPSVRAAGRHGSRRERCERAARVHARRMAVELAKSPLLAPRVESGRLLVAAAYYRLVEGTVEILDVTVGGEAATADGAHEAA